MRKVIIISILIILFSPIIFADLSSKISSNSNVITSISPQVVWSIDKTGAEKDLIVTYDIIDKTSTKFCINFLDKQKYESALSISAKDITQIPITKIDALDTSFNLEKTKTDLSNADKIDECFTVNYDELIEGMSFKIGWNSVIIHSNAEADGGMVSWRSFIFYDSNNNRWHSIIENVSNTLDFSSSDGLTWFQGGEIQMLTDSWNDFDCAVDINGTDSYLHCASGTANNNVIRYIRCNLTGTVPYIECASEDSIFISSDNTDDVISPNIELDSNRCVMVAFGLEDDSEPVQDEWEIALVIENDTECGDGIVPQFVVPTLIVNSDQPGYDYPGHIGIKSFGDLDAQIFWIDNTDGSSADLETIYYNGTSNSTGTQVTMDADVEFHWNTIGYPDWGTWGGYDSIILNNNTITVAMDDGTQDLDAYILTSKRDTTVTQVDTGLNLFDSDSSGFGDVSLVVDTLTNDIWVFARDSTDNDDIYYAISSDYGQTWHNQTLWQDETSTTYYFISSYFNEETCDIMVTWLGASGEIHSDIINTGSCYTTPILISHYFNTSTNNEGNYSTDNIYPYVQAEDNETDSLIVYETVYNGTVQYSFMEFGNITNDTITVLTVIDNNITADGETWTHELIVSDSMFNTTRQNISITIIPYPFKINDFKINNTPISFDEDSIAIVNVSITSLNSNVFANVTWYYYNGVSYSINKTDEEINITAYNQFINISNLSSDVYVVGDQFLAEIKVYNYTDETKYKYSNSSLFQIGDLISPAYVNISYTNSVTLGDSQVITITYSDNSDFIALTPTLNYTTPGGATGTLTLSRQGASNVKFTTSFLPAGVGTYTFSKTIFEDGSGNSNSEELNTESFTVTATALPGGGGGGAPDLAELGESCTDNSDCLSLLCDTMVTLTCVETLCGNGFCDESSGESINNCAQDCTVLSRFDWSQATFARWAFYFFIAIVFILIIEPDFWGKSKKYLIGGRRRR